MAPIHGSCGGSFIVVSLEKNSKERPSKNEKVTIENSRTKTLDNAVIRKANHTTCVRRSTANPHVAA